MKSGSRPTSVISQRSNLSVSPSFQSTHRALPILNTLGFVTEYRGGANAPLITVHNTTNLPKARIRQKANQQRKELFEWLSEENPPPATLLAKLSECTTPYAKLFKITSEELNDVIERVRSEQIDELSRESQLACAKLEVETHQQQEKLARIEAANQEIQEQLKSKREILDALNKDIDRMHLLMSYSENNAKTSRSARVIDRDQPEADNETIDLDNEKYDQLWCEQNELNNQLQALAETLKEKQAQQVVEIHEYVKRKNPRVLTVM